MGESVCEKSGEPTGVLHHMEGHRISSGSGKKLKSGHTPIIYIPVEKRLRGGIKDGEVEGV